VIWFVVAAVAVGGRAQADDQARCLSAVHKAGRAVAVVQGKEALRCLAARARSVDDPSLRTCLVAESTRLARARAKVEAAVASRCGGAALPDFGLSDGATVNRAAESWKTALVGDVFGTAVETTLVERGDDRAGARCQRAVMKQAGRRADARIGAFRRCLAAGLRDGSVSDAVTLADRCVFPIDAGSARKAASSAEAISTALEQCGSESTPPGTLLAGRCVGAVSSLASCIASAADCRACLYVNDAAGIDADCDLLDDGAANGSCVVDDARAACVDDGVAGAALPACAAYCEGPCEPGAGETCDVFRAAVHAETGRAALPCDCAAEAEREATLLADFPPPAPEPVVRAVLPVPAGVDSDSVSHPTFHPDGEHLVWAASLTGETTLHIMLSRIDGSDFSCLTCPLGAGLPFAKPDVFPDGRRVVIGNQVALGLGSPLPFASPFPDAETVPILECTPSLLDCQTPELVYVRVPYDPADAALFPNQRVREFRIAPDGVHLGWTQARSAVPLTLVPLIGELRREADRYELDHVEALVRLDPAMRPRPDGTFDFALPASGEIKRFIDGGASIALLDQEYALNGDAARVDVATGSRGRLTHHPDYDEPIDVSPDGEWLVVGSKRSLDPAFDVLAAFGLVPRPSFVELAGSILYSGWSFAGNLNGNRGLDTWLVDRHGARGGYIGQQLSDDPCYGGFERQHWNADGTRVAKREQIRPLQVGEPACAGLPSRRIVVYELTSRTPVAPGDRVPVVSTPDAPWAAGITEVKNAPVLEPGTYVVPGRIFGEARVSLVRVGEELHVEYESYSDDGLVVLDGEESIALDPLSVPYTADLAVSGCRSGFLESDASLDGFAAQLAIFAPLSGSVRSQLGDEHYEVCAPGQPGLDSCP